MEVFVHLIRLHPHVDPAVFESWVHDVDYATCPDLPSVRAFSVQRVADTPGQYFEVIQVSTGVDFERDMQTPVFKQLETAFDTMATVVQELAGIRLEPGYRAD